MRPGEIIPGDGPTPTARARRRARVSVRNGGALPAYLGSHFELVRASAALELDRAALEGARPDLPAGASARIAPGETVELDVIWD